MWWALLKEFHRASRQEGIDSWCFGGVIEDLLRYILRTIVIFEYDGRVAEDLPFLGSYLIDVGDVNLSHTF